MEWLFGVVVGGLRAVVLGVEPALWDECARLGKDGRIVVDEHVGHRDGRVWRDDIIAILDRAVRERAFQAVCDAVAYPQAFGDDGREVGEVF